MLPRGCVCVCVHAMPVGCVLFPLTVTDNDDSCKCPKACFPLSVGCSCSLAFWWVEKATESQHLAKVSLISCEGLILKF